MKVKGNYRTVLVFCKLLRRTFKIKAKYQTKIKIDLEYLEVPAPKN